MRPKPMRLTPLKDERYVRDLNTGLAWHRTSHRVLYADTDCSGAVYHSNHLVYFEMARAALMRDVNHPYSSVERSGWVYPVVKAEVNYYQALGYDDLMWILTRPGKLERVRVSFDYVILRQDEDRSAADGVTVHCALNADRVPSAVDPETLKVWEGFPS